MKPVRRLMARLQSLGADGLLQTPRPPSDGAARSGEQAGGGKTAGSGKTHSLGVHLRQSPSVSPEEVDALLKSDPVTAEDMLAALATTRPSSDGNMNKYTDWQTEFGAV